MFDGDPFLRIAGIAFSPVGMQIGYDREDHASILLFPRLKIPDPGCDPVRNTVHDSALISFFISPVQVESGKLLPDIRASCAEHENR